MADTIKLNWNGRDYFVPRSKLMRARQIIESVYSLKELATHMQEDTPHLVRLSMAYGALLRYLGAQVEDDELYEGMFGDDQTLGGDAALMLFHIMLPEKLRSSADGEEPQANPTSPSKTSSKRRSAKVG
jgi:hypothetical protein